MTRVGVFWQSKLLEIIRSTQIHRQKTITLPRRPFEPTIGIIVLRTFRVVDTSPILPVLGEQRIVIPFTQHRGRNIPGRKRVWRGNLFGLERLVDLVDGGLQTLFHQGVVLLVACLEEFLIAVGLPLLAATVANPEAEGVVFVVHVL